MLRSLRFRLPALFLAGMLVAALVTADRRPLLPGAQARPYLRPSSDSRPPASPTSTRSRRPRASARAARRPASRRRCSSRPQGRASTTRACRSSRARSPACGRSPRGPRRGSAGCRLARRRSSSSRREATASYLAAAHPDRPRRRDVRRPRRREAARRAPARWLALVQRVGIAFLAGLAVALGLVWYLSRRLTEPVLALSRAADQVAERRYGAELPEPSSSGRRDRPSHRAVP